MEVKKLILIGLFIIICWIILGIVNMQDILKESDDKEFKNDILMHMLILAYFEPASLMFAWVRVLKKGVKK